MDKPESPFLPGVEVAWRYSRRIGPSDPWTFGKVAKVHKSGNFTLDVPPDSLLRNKQFRPRAPSSYEKGESWRASGAGYTGPAVMHLTERSRKKIEQDNAESEHATRLSRVCLRLDRLAARDISPEALLQIEALIPPLSQSQKP